MVLLAAVCVVSITLGTRLMSVHTIWQALVDFDPASTSQTVIREIRVPRTLIGLTAGAALGLAGAVLQAATRNPLADPGILGINGGAAAAIVTAIVVLGTQSLSTYVWFSFVGAGLAVVTVYTLASLGRAGATPVKLALAGAAVSAGLYALTSALRADRSRRAAGDQVLAGRLAGGPLLPRAVADPAVPGGRDRGRALSPVARSTDSPWVTTLPSGLGQNVARTRLTLFVDRRRAVRCRGRGMRTDRVLGARGPASGARRRRAGLPVGAGLHRTPVTAVLLVADVIGRLAVQPGELQVGVVLGILGAPVFIGLVRYKDLAAL